MHLLPFLDIGVVLCDTTERELVHEVDLVGGLHVFLLQRGRQDVPGEMRQQRARTLKSLTIIGNVALNSMT